ncbi:MAG TPA: SET domain-containing protein-lysine N-methyltransferase [Anaeromyxobacteraceae bacterium]|nr:SET domain-containing protein-lysine N-methyltransferase [Anaeromyxobacteraceae bacterium]
MLLVKTRLDRSSIHGIGLFAAERIRRGTAIWRLDPTLDRQLTGEQIAALAPPARAQVEKYTYLDRVLGQWILCGDDARFFNHADEPNCHDFPDAHGGTTLAARDIEEGEELTCDYASFDASWTPHPR